MTLARLGRRDDDRQRMIDYNAHAVVLGTEPTETQSRGGKLAEGALGKMIAVALDHIGKGYVGVMILVGGETWQRNKIKEVSQRTDFPK
jgi:hypothetical protein